MPCALFRTRVHSVLGCTLQGPRLSRPHVPRWADLNEGPEAGKFVLAFLDRRVEAVSLPRPRCSLNPCDSSLATIPTYFDGSANPWVLPPAAVVSNGITTLTSFYHSWGRDGELDLIRTAKVVLTGAAGAGKTRWVYALSSVVTLTLLCICCSTCCYPFW